MDSMVNHYTVSKKRRHNDAFTPGGVYGKRPDYATVVYGNLIPVSYTHLSSLFMAGSKQQKESEISSE